MENKNPSTKLKSKKTTHKYLRYTSFLLIISILYFLFNQNLKETPKLEYVLALLLTLTVIFSQIFWNNPIKNSKIHKIDAIIAKTTIFSFIIYILIYKFKLSFIFFILAMYISFCFSDKYSNQEWCCNDHIFWHGLLHIICFICSLYAFYPIPSIII